MEPLRLHQWVRRAGDKIGSPLGEVVGIHGGHAWVKWPGRESLEPTTHNMHDLERIR